MHLPAVGVAIRVWKLGAKAFGYREQKSPNGVQGNSPDLAWEKPPQDKLYQIYMLLKIRSHRC